MKIEEAIKQRQFTDNYQKLIVDLFYTANWARDEQVKMMKAYGILPQHYNALRIIRGRSPEPISPGEIREVLIDKANDLTRLLDKLEKNKWIKRRLCPANRRRIDVIITSQGLKLLKEIDKPMKAFTNELKKRISDKEAEKVAHLLDKMRG